MADKKTRALTGPRQLKLMVPYYYGTYVDGDGFPSMNGWSGTGVGATGNFVYYESTIDVNLALDDLTMFPQVVMLQDPGIYTKSPDPIPGSLFDSMQVVDIISVKQLDPVTLKQDFVTGRGALPGMLGTTDDFNQIIMGTWRLMANNSNLGQQANIMVTVDAGDFSSASPFAQDRLWCYRFLFPITTDLTGVVCGSPASRFILNVVVGQEDDLPYMMRLKNSYELQ